MDSTSGNWRQLATTYSDGVACPPREAAVITAALLADLSRFHRAGKVHGAIDPTHALLSEGGRARLADPGRDSATPAYQSPEQHAGQTASPRSDLFSIGLVFYRLLTGINPFDGVPTLVKQRVTNMMAPRPSEVRAGVPHGFDAVMEKALAKHPSDRYANAEAFAEALMQALVPGTGSESGGDDTTLATTVMRRPSDADATIMRGSNPDPTVLRRSSDGDATIMRGPRPDATVLRGPMATTRSASSSDETARGATPPHSPAPKAGGSKGVVIVVAVAALLAIVGGAAFLFK